MNARIVAWAEWLWAAEGYWNLWVIWQIEAADYDVGFAAGEL